MLFEERIRQAERIREEGKPYEAAEALDIIAREAERANDRASQASAVSHQLVCHQLLWGHGKDRSQLGVMRRLAGYGLVLADTYPAARDFSRIFEYRLGIALLRLGKVQQALIRFTTAAQGLGPEHPQYPEYNSYRGLAEVRYNAPGMGFAIIEDALRHVMAARARYTEEWRWLIHRTGVMLRMAEAYAHIRDFASAQGTLDRIMPLAAELRDQHRMPHRWEDYLFVSNQLGSAERDT
jgi:hypothetical protein